MKNMIKSIVAGVAMTLFASVGLAATNITFCVGEKAEFTYSGSSTYVLANRSTPTWSEFITSSDGPGKVTFQGKLDTTNEVKIVLSSSFATAENDRTFFFNVKTVEIEKTIMAWNNPNEALTFPERYDPDNKSNSTIRVVTHVLKGNITTRDPNVLFLGTRCGAHDLKRDTVMKSINALLSIGNVDYYLFDSDTTATAKADDTYTGKKVKGQTVTASDIYSSEFPTEGNHSALSGFYNELYKIATDDNTHMRAGEVYKYDYIVIETDGTRLAHKYALEETETQLAKMKRVAEYLAPFYEDKKMIWVLDNGFDYYYNDLSTTSRNYFYYATKADGYSQEIYQYGRTNELDVANTNAYRVNNGYIRNSGQQNQYFNRLDDLAWRAFVGIFDPSLYLDNVTNKTTQFYVESKFADVRVSTGSSSYERENLELYAGHKYEIQTWYDNAESLGDYLRTIVQPIPFNAVIADSVVQTYGGVDDMGLSLIDGANSVRFYEVNTKNWKPGDEAPDTDDTNAWVAVTSGWGVNTETMAVTATVKRIVSEWWNKIEVDIEDNGTFFAKCLATGRYEGPDKDGNYLLNPNKDEATVELYDDTGKLITKRAGAVDPTQQWEFDPRNMVVRFEDVEKTYNGIPTNICLVSIVDAEVTSSNITSFCTISNSFDEVNWYSEEDFKALWLVNATPASNVYWKVSALGYNTTNGVNTVTINPIKVTVKSEDLRGKRYDGIAGTNWAATVTSGEFLEGDTVTYKYDGTQTDAGVSSNGFSIASFSKPEMAQNYSITLVTGLIEVVRAPILVEADDAEKVYGTLDPKFSWSLDPAATAIAVGETNEVYKSLTNVVKLARCSTNEPPSFTDLEEDVGTYKEVITTNTPFAVQTTGILKNYDLSFAKGDFEITPDKLSYEPPEPDEHTPEADPYGYVGIYDGEKHTIRFKVVPAVDSNDAPAQVRFATGAKRPADDAKAWSAWEDYNADGVYASIVKYTHCTNKAPVYVQAQNLPNYPDITNLVAYVTITQRTVYVTAASTNRVYNGQALTHNVVDVDDPTADSGFVSGDRFESTTMTADSAIINVGTTNNVLDTYVITGKGYESDYRIVKKNGTLEITPAQIIDESEEKDPTKRTTPWASAVDTVCWTNDSDVVTAGTNILVTTKLFGDDKATLLYSLINPTNVPAPTWVEESVIKAQLRHICATQVWCQVSGGDNYLPTNVTAFVYILSKSSDVTEDVEPEDELQDTEKTEEKTAVVLDNIMKNHELNKDGSKNPKYDSSKPGFTENQLDAKVGLQVTSMSHLPIEEQIPAGARLQQTIEDYKKAHPDVPDVTGRYVDVKLMYNQTFADERGTVKEDIGSDNSTVIPFTLSVEQDVAPGVAGGVSILAVYRYHSGVRQTLKQGGTSDGCYQADWKNDKLTIYASQYSEFIILTGTVQPVEDHDAEVYDYKASVKYVDFKQVCVTGGKVWVKTVKSVALKGYLVTPKDNETESASSGRSPGFLVLTSSLAKKYDKDYQVKLMPANLLADIWAQKSIAENAKSATLEAQGYLFAGLGKSDFPAPDGSPAYGFGDLNVTEATKYLFGQANIEDADGQFIEPFLDAAGFGKADYATTAAPICGKGTKGYSLKSLSGRVIGGSWSCLANTFYEGWRCQGWDNEAISVGTDYSGYDKLYNVISGTWQIKRNIKIQAADLNAAEKRVLSDAKGSAPVKTAQLVKACGQKLQKTFTLATFDDDGIYNDAFVQKWFAPVD